MQDDAALAVLAGARGAEEGRADAHHFPRIPAPADIGEGLAAAGFGAVAFIGQAGFALVEADGDGAEVLGDGARRVGPEKAGEVRFLPVLLTALTAIGGLIPLVMDRSPLYSPLAMVSVEGTTPFIVATFSLAVLFS